MNIDKDLIYNIICLIRHKDDYNSVSQIMINYDISIEKLVENTIKLTDIEIAKIADSLIENINNI